MAAYIYLETALNSGVFNCRGEVGAGDNPDSFASMMAKSGLRVIATDGSEFDWARDEQGQLIEVAGAPVRVALHDVELELPGGLKARSIGALEGVNDSGHLAVPQRFQIVDG